LTCWLVAFNASGNYEWVLGCHCLFGRMVVVFVLRMGRTLEGGSLSLWPQIDPTLGGFIHYLSQVEFAFYLSRFITQKWSHPSHARVSMES
jgi:hypothetical protein